MFKNICILYFFKILVVCYSDEDIIIDDYWDKIEYNYWDINNLDFLPPTINPTVKPTINPTVKPTINPTVKPTVNPTVKSIEYPTVKPTDYSKGYGHIPSKKPTLHAMGFKHSPTHNINSPSYVPTQSYNYTNYPTKDYNISNDEKVEIKRNYSINYKDSKDNKIGNEKVQIFLLVLFIVFIWLFSISFIFLTTVLVKKKT